MTHGGDPWSDTIRTAKHFGPLFAVAASCVAIVAPFWKGAGGSVKATFGWLARHLNPNRKVHDKLDMLLANQTFAASQLTALMESETALRWGSTPDGRQIWASGALVALTGWQAGELLGWGWTNILNDDDRMATLDAWAEARAHGHIFDRRCNFITRTGRQYSGRLSARPIDAGDPQSLWIGEATEIKEARGNGSGTLQG